jgi:phosphohistidine phosphatase
MKTLLLVRHAKSSWDEPVSDIERPLNKRGKKDAPFMAELISKKIEKPDIIFSSQAVRALDTAKYFASAFNYPENEIRVDNIIYHEGASGIISMLKKLDEKITSVMVFGHNPILTYLASMLFGKAFDDVPTCAVICFELEIEAWTQIDDMPATLQFFEYPKKY